MAHYRGLYGRSDAAEIAARTGLVYDEAAGGFKVSVVGNSYYVNHPDFKTQEPLSPYEEILLLRYLLEGRYVPASGGMLAYEEMPWGAVYLTQFRGRVIGRIAREFGRDPSRLGAVLAGTPGLKFEEVGGADAAYRFEFMNGLYISILVWAGDDEFKASAQMLFSDNFKYAFTAEDMAVVGDVVMGRFKNTSKALGI